LIFLSKILLALALGIIFLTANNANVEVSVGVKAGDWIEYQVTATGTLPQGFNLTWARMEILHVHQSRIVANITTKSPEGNYSFLVTAFDEKEGKIGAWFIIPANLNVGDTFYDELLGRNVTVEGEEQLEFAGATRAVTNATTPERTKRWDKPTGVFVECIDVFEDFSVTARAVCTNMWGRSEPWVDSIVVYAFMLVIPVVVASVSFAVHQKRKFPLF